MKYFVYCRKSTEDEGRQVLSISSQKAELNRIAAARPDIEIIETFEESKTAKAPGREIFNRMVSRIQKGEAEGVLCWKLDRLARNPVDEGTIKWLLQTAVLKNIKTADRDYYPGDNVLVASVEFGMANQYIRDLSHNVKRGFRAKLANGWKPNQPPLGYRTDKETRTIVQVPDLAKIVRSIFELYLTGQYSIPTIAAIAEERWAFRSPVSRKRGGTPLSVSGVHKILTNPFYAGTIVWKGELYPGKHVPIVTSREFARVQALLNRRDNTRAKAHFFAYRGLGRCGTCNRSLTAERKINRYGYQYAYYHCSRNQVTTSCDEPAIEEESFEAQIREAFVRLALTDSVAQWLVHSLTRRKEALICAYEERRGEIEGRVRELRRQLDALTDIRLRGMIADDEFVAKRQTLHAEVYSLEQWLQEPSGPITSIEPLSKLISFGTSLVSAFDATPKQKRRLIVETVVSNLSARDRKLIFQAAIPFDCAAQIVLLPRERELEESNPC